MNRWLIAQSEDGWHVRVVNQPWAAAIADEALDKACAATGHRLCGTGWNEFAWSIPTGWPHFDADGQLDNAFPSTISNAWLGLVRFVDRFEGDGTKIPIPETLARVLVPDAWFDDGEDAVSA